MNKMFIDQRGKVVMLKDAGGSCRGCIYQKRVSNGCECKSQDKGPVGRVCTWDEIWVEVKGE